MSPLALLAFGTVATIPLRVPAPSPVASQVTRRLARGENLRIALYGTSLSAFGPWTTQIKDALDLRFPGQAEWINVSGSGKYSEWGVANLERRVLGLKPDAVFLEFGVNDAVARFHCPVWKAKANLETMIDRIRQASPATEIVLLTTNPVIGLPPGHRSYRHRLSDYYATIREVARSRQTVLVDQEPVWAGVLASQGPAKYRQWVPDGIHPSAAGCSEVSTPAILQGLGAIRSGAPSYEGRIFDVIVYGGNLAGVKAAARARQRGKSVLLVCPERQLGEAMPLAGGEPWYTPPKPALPLDAIHRLIAQNQIPVVRAQVDPREIYRRNGKVVALGTIQGGTYSGRVVIDATFDTALNVATPSRPYQSSLLSQLTREKPVSSPSSAFRSADVPVRSGKLGGYRVRVPERTGASALRDGYGILGAVATAIFESAVP